MDTRFILPAGVATALHTLVLFGLGGGPMPPRDPVVTHPVDTFINIVRDDPPPPEDPAEEPQTAVRRGNPAALRPTLDEPPTQVAVFEMTRTPQRSPVDVHPDRIVPGEWGEIDGVADLGLDPGTIVSPGLLDRAPATRVRVPPVYPTEARNRGLTGEVVVAFVVDETGRVLHPHIVRSSDRLFEGPSLRAVEKWRFEPGRQNGKPVRFRMEVPLVFNLAD